MITTQLSYQRANSDQLKKNQIMKLYKFEIKISFNWSIFACQRRLVPLSIFQPKLIPRDFYIIYKLF